MIRIKYKILISFLITLFSVFYPLANVGAPDIPPQMHIVQTEKSTEISFESEVVPQNIGVPNEAIYHNGQLVVCYLDVGQGLSVFIILPNQESILIDAGNPGHENFIINYIKGSNVDTIDYAINTHPHNDHIGSLSGVLQAFEVKNIFMPDVKAEIQAYKKLENTIRGKRLEVKTAKAGVKLFDYPDLSAEFVAPNKEHYSNLNNYSAVLLLKYKENSFLFTGDCEKISEDEILDNGYNIKADVLNVGHHGASTSSTDRFIKAVNPKYAVISCGPNSYGHPTEQTLAALINNNIEIFRTDLQSTVVAVSDGFNITLSSNYNSIEINAPPPEEKQKPTNTAKPENKTENSTEKTVFITNTGKKFHREGCRSLAKSKITKRLSEVSQSYEACKICKP